MSASSENAKAPRSGRPGWHRFLKMAAFAGLAGIAAWAAYFGWSKFSARQHPQHLYQIVSVQRGDLEDLVAATGTIQPREYVDVGAQVSGQLRKIHVEVGSVVAAGDLLAEIDPTVYLANVDARRAQLRNQQATLADRQSQLALARLQLTRQENLMAGDATTAESLQAAEAAVRSAKAQMDALRAQIEQTESTLRADEANLNYAKIYAPIAGVVVSITARQGQTLNATQQSPTLLRVADLSVMTVQTQVSEADVGQLRPDMDVYFTTLGSRAKRWYGSLRKVEPTPTVTNNVVLYNALFDVSNAQRALLPQMTAQVFFVAAAAKNVLFVPAAAVAIAREGNREDRQGEATPRLPAADGKVQESARTKLDEGGNRPVGRPEDENAAAGRIGSDNQSQAGDRFRGMTREERRAALEKMPPEERQVFLERQRARRSKAEESTADTGAASASGIPGAAGTANAAGRNRAPASSPQDQNATASAPAPALWNGAAPRRARGPRDATVKVVTAAGAIEERKVRVGISNRVQVEILSGLNEGEQVIAGVKQNAAGGASQRGAGQRNALQSSGSMPPGGMSPGGMPPGGRLR